MLKWLLALLNAIRSRQETTAPLPEVESPAILYPPTSADVGQVQDTTLELTEEVTEEINEEVVVVEENLTIDKSAFYGHLRNTLLRSGIRTNHTKAMDALLLDMYGRPTSWIAYALATAWHETGGNMKPNAENLNYSVQGLLNTFGRHRISEADARRLGRQPGEGPLSVARQRKIGNIIYGGEWGRTNLGNTEPNDGWDFRGRGMDHCTGRRNYRVTGNDIGLDLIAEPGLLLVLENALKALHTGMVTGRYAVDRSGRHSFARHLPRSGNATRAQFREARRIINGVDKADQIAGHALIFQEALNAGGYRK
jgi:putative chitinase